MKKVQEHLLYIVIFLIPWQARYFFVQAKISGQYWEYGSFFVYGTELFILILLGSILLRTQLKQSKNHIMHALFILVTLTPVLGILAAEGFRIAIHAYSHFILAGIVIILLTTLSYDKKKALTALVLSGIAQSILAMWQVIDQSVFANTLLGMSGQHPGDLGVIVVETASLRFLRAYGSLPHPNILGGFLAISFLASLNIYTSTKDKRIYTIGFAGIPIITIGLCLTMSRSALLGLAIGLISMYVYSKRKTSIVKALMTPTIVIAILTLALLPFVSTRIGLSPSRLETQSIVLRGNFTIDSFLVIGTFPWTGVGMGNYTLFMYHLFPLLEPWEYQPVHNMYLLSAAEWGFFQAMIFWGAIFYLLYLNRKSPFAPMLVTLLIIGLFDHYLFTNHAGRLMLFVSIGLLLSTKELSSNNSFFTAFKKAAPKPAARSSSPKTP